MTSARKCFTNRLNARRSTGPKTRAGKARSSRNALRHGLSVSLALDGGYPTEVESLAKAIAGKNANARQFEIGCRIAVAQLNLLQVRQIRHCLLSAAARDFFCRWIHPQRRQVERPEIPSEVRALLWAYVQSTRDEDKIERATRVLGA